MRAFLHNVLQTVQPAIDDIRTTCTAVNEHNYICGACTGFGTLRQVKQFAVVLRKLNVRVLQFAFPTRKDHFEGIFLLRCPQASADAVCTQLDSLLDTAGEALKMGLTFIDLGDLWSASMMTCIDRVLGDEKSFGTWNTRRNKVLRSTWAAQKEKRVLLSNHQRVFEETNMHFSTGNMLTLFYNANNLRMEISTLRTRLRVTAQALVTSHRSLVNLETNPSISQSIRQGITGHLQETIAALEMLREDEMQHTSSSPLWPWNTVHGVHVIQ